jgi:hypothetical protein
MLRSWLPPLLALAMLMPPGVCTCEHGARACQPASDPDAAAVSELDAKPKAHRCRRHHHPEPTPPAESLPSQPDPYGKSPPAPTHDPSCPAVQPVICQAVVRDVQPEPLVLPAERAQITFHADLQRESRPATPLPGRTGEPPPLYLRLCTFLI